jgi:hypothetical protein
MPSQHPFRAARDTRKRRRRAMHFERLEDRSLLSTSIGSLDPTFGTAGEVTTDFPRADGGPAAAIQSDGTLVIAGPVFIGSDRSGDP